MLSVVDLKTSKGNLICNIDNVEVIKAYLPFVIGEIPEELKYLTEDKQGDDIKDEKPKKTVKKTSKKGE